MLYYHVMFSYFTFMFEKKTAKTFGREYAFHTNLYVGSIVSYVTDTISYVTPGKSHVGVWITGKSYGSDNNPGISQQVLRCG